MADPADILNAVVAEVDHGKPAALCVIVATRGSTPQPAGVMVCVDEQAKMTGTLGGGCVEADIRNRAREALRTGDSPLLTFELDFEFGLDEGMICGGALDVAVRVINDRAQAAVLAEAAERIRAGESAVLPIRVLAPPAGSSIVSNSKHLQSCSSPEADTSAKSSRRWLSPSDSASS